MGNLWSRHVTLASIAFVLAIGVSGISEPAAAQGTLARVKAAGVLKIGIADNIPWSRMNPDGTMTGLAPLQVVAAAKKIGIPKVEAIVATYGDLIPGLLAGRWDMVGAALTISEARCAQILFTDPFYRTDDDGSVIAYLPGTLTTMPKTLEDVARQFDTIGMPNGASVPVMQKAIETAKGKAQLVQFRDIQLAVEALRQKRVPVVVSVGTTMTTLVKTMGGFEFTRVDDGQPIRGSAGAFRKEDADFRDAFAAAQRELNKSGEVEKILKQFELAYDAKLMNISGEDACKL